ncbi:hypothetical protein B0H13DRAFT_2284158 [Mycena leptocephala]|nr:hypothetical protein B0H13DRAFT_2284158 [Mycena leptocephala]
MSSLSPHLANDGPFVLHDLQPPNVNNAIFHYPKRGCCRRLQLRRVTSGASKRAGRLHKVLKLEP